MKDNRLEEFEAIFREHFGPLCGFAQYHINDADEAKGIVHDVFLSVWTNFDKLDTGKHFKSYLYTAVRSRCLNFIRNNARIIPIGELEEQMAATEDNSMETNELKEVIEKGLEKLPVKCREVFELSRIEGLKYTEIAEKLNISVKTVEAQMSKALRIMRKHLSPFLMIVFYLMMK